MRMRITGALSLLMVAVISSGSFAQSAPSELDVATVAFDLRMGKMRNGQLMNLLDVEKELGEMQESGQIPNDIDITKVDRIFGAMSLPDDVATFQQMDGAEGADLPFDMFVTIEFADKTTADAMFDKMMEKSEAVELNGRQFYAPTDENTPSNLIMRRANDKTIEVGTKNYLAQDKRKELFSQGLSDAWGKVPDHAIRVAIDVEAESALISEAIEMGKANAGDPTASAYFDLIDNATDLRLSIDLDSSDLVVLAATGVDETEAEELRSGLDSIMGMAKFGGQQALAMAPPNISKVAKEILESLEATAEGTDVKVAVPKPEGFNEAVKQMVDQFKQMQEMMKQGPPDGFGSGDDDGFGSGDDDGDGDQ